VPPAVPDDHAITIHLDKLLADRGMTLTELSERVGVSVVNLSILKNGHARAIRFSILTRALRGPRLPARRPARPPQRSQPKRTVRSPAGRH
jgi:putative transcriptional regulator